MNTQIELARALTLTPQMEAVAAAEGLPAEYIREKLLWARSSSRVTQTGPRDRKSVV